LTVVPYSLPEEGAVELVAVDLGGRIVARLASGLYAVGEHSSIWDAACLPSGVYIIRLSAPQGVKLVKAAIIQ